MRENKRRFSTLKRARGRRLGLSAGADRDLRGGLRRRGAACLGHDRDEPGRHRRAAQGQASRAPSRRPRRASKRSRAARMFGVDLKIVDGEGSELPWDGIAFGDLLVRGPWIAGAYFKEPASPLRRRLVPDRRRRDHRSRRLHPDHRPLQGRDQERRRMDQLDRAREHRRRPSRRRRGGGDRRHASEMGRAAAAHRPAPRRRRRRRARSCWLSTTARSRNGGCRTMSSSSRRCRTPRPASSSRPSSAATSPIIGCRAPETSPPAVAPGRAPRRARRRAGNPAAVPMTAGSMLPSSVLVVAAALCGVRTFRTGRRGRLPVSSAPRRSASCTISASAAHLVLGRHARSCRARCPAPGSSGRTACSSAPWSGAARRGRRAG